jgi:hypothetical protein
MLNWMASPSRKPRKGQSSSRVFSIPCPTLHRLLAMKSGARAGRHLQVHLLGIFLACNEKGTASRRARSAETGVPSTQWTQ